LQEATVEIAVCLKRVPDTAEAEVKVDASGRDIVRDKLAYTINEADNYALEEALLAKEKHNANVTVVSVGPKQAEEVLRMGMAKGAAAAVRIDDADLGTSDPIALARVLASFFTDKNFDVVMCGAIATDDGNSQVGPALAELLGRPHAAYVTRLDIQPDKLVVKRELEGGFLEVKELSLPAVVTIQTGGNSPRYASIMGIKRAGAKTVDQLAPAGLGGVPESRTTLVKLYVPQVTSAAQMLDGTTDEKAAKMAQLLKEKGAV
jgi:electron transfer flavoprotein beta subunit